MNSATESALFLHGGPGLHSEVERRLLAPVLEDSRFPRTSFWDEPSALRGSAGSSNSNPGFAASLESAASAALQLRAHSGSRVHLVGHSFGALLALALVRREAPGTFASVTLVSPFLDATRGLRALVQRAANDSRLGGNAELADDLERSLAAVRSARDPELRRALARAFEFPGIMGYYWKSQPALGEWAAVMGEPKFGIDWTAQAQVLATLPELADSLGTTPLPVRPLVIFGAHDLVSERERELATLRAFCEPARVVDFAGSAHFPHLEERERFAREWLELAGRSAAAAAVAKTRR